MGKIVNNVFIDFYNKINDPELAIDALAQRISAEFGPVAEFMHIGRFTETFSAPETMLSIKGETCTVNVHISEKGIGDMPVTHSYITGENGSVDMVFFPEKGYEWDEEEKQDVKFVSDLLFMIQGKARISTLIRKFYITDMPTGAPNTAGIVSYCEKLRAMGLLDKFTLMFFNLKNFKFVNQVAGERQGDKVIREYTHKLMNYIVGDEMVARAGGDNFIALIKKERENEFIKFISNVPHVIEMGGRRQHINISARVGVFPINSDDSVSVAVDGAAAALNKAKKNGVHDVVRFGTEGLAQTLRANEISNLFPAALKNREFAVYYQPKVNLADNTLCGCEALTRWIKDGKPVSPAEFIPVLEGDGSICRLDFYVLETVCADIRRWLDDGMNPVRVSTNFSKIHLNNPDLAEDIIGMIRKYDIDTKFIEIELTESSGYEDFGALEDFVRKMREYGVSTSIDDFGTGYSSLNMLKNLDVDIIKLDKSFLDNLESDKTDDGVVIRHIINMVNELKMQVVAEGVETKHQAEMLDNINCSMAQGYLFDRPLPCDEFEKRLSGKRKYESE